jgi:hypothetical protein
MSFFGAFDVLQALKISAMATIDIPDLNIIKSFFK